MKNIGKAKYFKKFSTYLPKSTILNNKKKTLKKSNIKGWEEVRRTTIIHF